MKSIKLRLIITFSLVILVVTGFLGIFTVQVVNNDLKESSNLELLSLAVNNAELVRAKMDAEIGYMEALAENSTILSDELSAMEIGKYMEAEAARAGYLGYALVDMNGAAVTLDTKGDTLDVSDRDYFQSAVKGVSAVSDIIISRVTGTPVLIVAVPIYKDGEQVGVLYGRKDGNTLSDIAKGISYGETGYGYMVNEASTVVGHVEDDRVFKQFNLVAAAVENELYQELADTFTNQMSLREQGVATYYFEGTNRVVGFAPVENTHWVMVVGVHEYEVMASVNRMQNILIALVLVSIVLGAAITYFVSDSIAKPILYVTKVIQKQSNLDFTLSDDKDNKKFGSRKDEIGRMIAAMGVMQENIRDFIIKTSESAQQVAAAAQQLTATSEQSTTTAEEVARAIEEIARGAMDQARDTGTTAMSVESMGRLLEADAVYNEELAMAAARIEKEKEDGMGIVKILVHKSEENSQATMLVYDAIMSNNESAEKIEKASSMIQNIADQTNLLALNAAIEAARAGEAGKGFAVVADEIRKLAEQSSNFTNEIKVVISELKNKSGEAVDTMMEVKEIVEQQSYSVNDTDAKFKGIAEAIDLIKEVSGKLSQSAKGMTENKNTVIELTQNLSAISEENAAGTQEASASMEEQAATIHEISRSAESLAEISQDLQLLIERFQV